MKRVILSLFLLLCAARLHAQMVDMPITVQATRILIGSPDFVPRRPDLSNLIVAPGTTFELAATAAFDYIEVQAGGTLRFSRTHDTALTTTHLFVLPGGRLDLGTVADPIPCDHAVTITFRNVPIDTTKDPFQWGNGLLNFGARTHKGCTKTPWVEAAGSIAAGSTSLTLASVPVNWRVGDELLIPDTDKPVITGDGVRLTAVPSRRESAVFIAALNGSTLTLSRPLDFEHLNITDPQGVVKLRPRIANLTRNIKLISENAATPTVGTRGHTADIGMGATWDVRDTEHVQLGRTTALPLNDFVPATGAIGTNQRGKYAEHHHHVGSCPTCVDDGNVYRGNSLTTKWGLALHVTSDVIVRNSIGIDFPGAIFATEDGPEVRNVFDHDFAAYSLGGVGEQLGTLDDVDIKNNCPGCSGAGFWLRGVRNSFIGIEAWNNFRGIDLFNQSGVAGVYPSMPGIMPDTRFVPTDNQLMQPIVFERNVAAANANGGLENWATHTFPNRNFIGAYNGVQIAGVLSDGIDHLHINPTLICKPDTGSVGIVAGQAYSRDFHLVNGGQIAGCAVGIHGGGGASGLFIDGPETLVLQNEVNIDQVPVLKMQLTNVRHIPLGTHPHQYVTFGNVGRFSGPIWHDDEPLPEAGVSYWRHQIGSQWSVKNWQGTGQDFLLFPTEMWASNAAMFSAKDVHAYNCPVAGLTVQQCWDTYGLAWGGDVLKDADKVVLDGVVNGFGRAGLGVTLGPPRAVVTFPTPRTPAVLVQGTPSTYYMNGLATGDLSQASPAFMISVDGQPPIDLHALRGDFLLNDRDWSWDVPIPGMHTVKVWLTQKANPTAPLAGSEMTAPFCTGPDCPVLVPIVKGLTAAYAAEYLHGYANLTVGTTTPITSETVTEGSVVRTVPPSGTVVPQQTAVNLTVSLGPPVPPPPPACVVPPPSPASPNGTTVPPAMQIVDASGMVWAIEPGQNILQNCQSQGGIGSVILFFNQAVFVLGNDSSWYQWTGSGFQKVGADPRGVTPPPPPPPVDVCPNIPGIQIVVPPGMVLDAKGQCVVPPPPPPPPPTVLPSGSFGPFCDASQRCVTLVIK